MVGLAPEALLHKEHRKWLYTDSDHWSIQLSITDIEWQQLSKLSGRDPCPPPLVEDAGD